MEEKSFMRKKDKIRIAESESNLARCTSKRIKKLKSQSQSQINTWSESDYGLIPCGSSQQKKRKELDSSSSKQKKKKMRRKKKKKKGLDSIISSKEKELDSSSKQKQQEKKKKQKQDCLDWGDTVEIQELLFTPERDFLVKNNGQLIRAADLEGKSVIVLFWSLVYTESVTDAWKWTLDMVDAYNRCQGCQGAFEVVFVGVGDDDDILNESSFNGLLSRMPWSAVPFSDKQACHRLCNAFGFRVGFNFNPFCAIIEPTNKIMITGTYYRHLFKWFDGLELVPLTRQRLNMLCVEDEKARKRKQPYCFDQLLASPAGRNHLLSSDGDEVPVSSLKDNKVIGLYFCENTPHPPRMESIKKVYLKAKKRGYDFEIVQINLHFLPQNCKYFESPEHLSVQQCKEKVPWLQLPFKDSRSRRLYRIFSQEERDYWVGDSLVIIDQHQPNMNGTFFEYCGADIIEESGIQAYPFTRRKIFEMESIRLKEEVKLQLMFTPGKCHLIRPRGAGGGCDKVTVSEPFRKRVLVLFARHSECFSYKFVSMLESKYRAQLQEEVEEKNKFEVVFISWEKDRSTFRDCIMDMPWFVYPYSWDFAKEWRSKLFKYAEGLSVAAFDAEGELVAKTSELSKDYNFETRDFGEYPFVSPDLNAQILRDLVWEYNLLDDEDHSILAVLSKDDPLEWC